MNAFTLALMTLFRWLFLAAVLGLILLCGLAHGQSSYVYSNDGTILYQKISVPYQYYQNGYSYTGYRWEYKKVADVYSKDWRNKVLDLIDKDKERAAFQSALGHIAPSLVAPATPQAANYPSAVGNTLGGFTRLEFSKYGPTTSFDGNKAYERSMLTIDQFNRASAENAKRGDEIHSSVASLIATNSEGARAIVELQETKSILRETMAGLRDQTLAQAELMRSIKPQGSERLTIQHGHAQSSSTGTSPGPVPPPPPVPPQGGGGSGRWNADMAAVVKQYCATCHSAGSPQGDFIFADGTPISETQFGSLALRMDPNAPEKRTDGRPFRMPTADSPQPSVEERRLIVDAAKVLVAP